MFRSKSVDIASEAPNVEHFEGRGYSRSSKVISSIALIGFIVFLISWNTRLRGDSWSTQLNETANDTGKSLELGKSVKQLRIDSISNETVAPRFGRILCQTTPHGANGVNVSVIESELKFYTKTQTASSVRIVTNQKSDVDLENLEIFWFQPDDISPSTEGMKAISNGETTIIDGLIANRSYLFCIVRRESRKVSPFGCRSHFVPRAADSVEASYGLRQILLTTSEAILSFFFAVIAVYCLLRIRPSLVQPDKCGIFEKSTQPDAFAVSRDDCSGCGEDVYLPPLNDEDNYIRINGNATERSPDAKAPRIPGMSQVVK